MLLVVVFIHEQSWPQSNRSLQVLWARSSALFPTLPALGCASTQGQHRGQGVLGPTLAQLQEQGSPETWPCLGKILGTKEKSSRVPGSGTHNWEQLGGPTHAAAQP